MAVIKMKPTSPGQRGVVKVTRDHLHKGEPYAPLLEPQHQKSGRNNNGHITTRHKGGGHSTTTVSLTSVVTKTRFPPRLSVLNTTLTALRTSL